MNALMLGLGIYAGFVACVHIFAGGKTVLAPTVGATFDGVAKETMRVCWHLVSINLVGFSCALIWMGATSTVKPVVTGLIAAHFLLYGLAFIVVALRSPLERALLELPQWVLLTPLGIALLWV